jgi:hypothetical protein
MLRMKGLDVLNVLYVVVSISTFVLAVVFAVMRPRAISMSSISTLDPNYANFLADIVFFPHAPQTVSLETIAVYKTETSKPVPSSVFFGMSSQYDFGSIAAYASLFTNDAIVYQLKRSKKKTTDTPVTFASPMWTYEHNLHLLDRTKCDAAKLQTNQLALTAAAPFTIALDVLSGPDRACVYSNPTVVEFRRCYNDMSRHQSLAIWLAASISVDMIVYIYFLYRQSTTERGNVYCNTCVSNCESVNFVWSMIFVGLFVLELMVGGAAVSDTAGACPDEQTGLLAMYEVFVACFAMQCVSVLLLNSKEMISPYIDALLPKQQVQFGMDSVARGVPLASPSGAKFYA